MNGYPFWPISPYVPPIAAAENFGGAWYGSIAPTDPSIGWLWWDTTGNFWIYDSSNNWVKVTSSTSGVNPSNSLPLMDGTAVPGTSILYSRGDHVHPSDTSRAPINSPVFTGIPAAPTATSGTSTTQIATTAFVGLAITAAAVPAPSTSNPAMDGVAAPGSSTLYSRGDHIHPTDTSRAPLASPIFTGTPAAPTATVGTNTTQLATTAFVGSAITAAAVPAPSGANPAMDGTAAPGVSALYSRGDHVHPTDTSRAPLASPIFTGTPAAPTATAGTNTTQLATTAFVTALGVTGLATVAPLMNGTAAVGTSTLATRQDHVHPTDTSRAPLASPALTGTPTSPTPTAGDSSTNVATTAFVGTAITNAAVPAPSSANPAMDGTAAPGSSALYSRGDHVHPTDTSRAPLASPTFTGTPAAPTATAGTNTTQLATTAFVTSAVSAVTPGGGDAGGYINKFRNPNFEIWQRGTTITCAAGANQYTADGWVVNFTGAAGNAQQNIGGAGQGDGRVKASLIMTGATGVTDLKLYQRIESWVATALSGQIVTVSAWVNNNTAVALTPTLTITHPASAADNYTSTVTDVSAVAMQSLTSAATWTRIAYTFQAATQVFGMQVLFDFGNNFSTSSKYMIITECDIRATPGVAIGINNSPPLLEYRPNSLELVYCLRYFYRMQLGSGSRLACLIYGAQNVQVCFPPFPVPLRAGPTTTDANISDMTMSDVATGVSVAATTSAFASFSPLGYGYANYAAPSSTMTLGHAGIVYSSSGTYYAQFSAEL